MTTKLANFIVSVFSFSDGIRSPGVLNKELHYEHPFFVFFLCKKMVLRFAPMLFLPGSKSSFITFINNLLSVFSLLNRLASGISFSVILLGIPALWVTNSCSLNF